MMAEAPPRNVAGPPNPAIVSTGAAFEEEHDGNGALGPGTALRDRLSTFGSGDTSRVYEDVAAREAAFAPSWDHPRELRAVVDFQPPVRVDGDTALPESIEDTTQYVATGDPEGGSPGWGFKVETDPSPVLKGIVHTGAEELELPLTRRTVGLPEPPDSGRVWLYGVQGSGHVSLWVDGAERFRGGDPTGGNDTAERLIAASVANNTPGDERRATDTEIKVTQWR